VQTLPFLSPIRALTLFIQNELKSISIKNFLCITMIAQFSYMLGYCSFLFRKIKFNLDEHLLDEKLLYIHFAKFLLSMILPIGETEIGRAH